jgi:iron-sulfur cluster assembly protein
MAELNIYGQRSADEPAGTLTITPAGAEGVKKFLKENNAPEGAVMRVGVRGGGCSGFSYVLEHDAAAARADDIVLAVHGVVVRVDKKSMRVLAGTTLDYKVGLMDAGFKFDNPRATKTCGCGESFSMS